MPDKYYKMVTEILSLEFFTGCIIFVILLIIGLISINRRKSKKPKIKGYKPDNQQDFDYYGEKRNPDYWRTDDTILFPKRQKTLYEEKLSDPKWKYRRKQILKRDHYQCQWCGNKDNLQIHHKYYSKYPDGKKCEPWDYPDEAFITLCDECHKKVHSKKKIKVYYRQYGKHFV